MKTIAKIFMVALLGVSLLQGAAFEKVAKSRATKVKLTCKSVYACNAWYALYGEFIRC